MATRARHNRLDRRAFLIAAGASFVSSLAPRSADAFHRSQEIFASAFQQEAGQFGLMIFNGSGYELARISLPVRGHDIAFSSKSDMGVVFARRPGNFAVAFSVTQRVEPHAFSTPANRHFYGHGTFSSDGRLLYATENDFDRGAGVIGIYDVTDRFTRLGEFSTYGIGPHEVLLHPTLPILIVANGGIETHPDFGRSKLNVPMMEPSLVFIDARTGSLLEKHTLPRSMHKLSIRHMDVDDNGLVVFGCQYEGSSSDLLPLVGNVEIGHEIKQWHLPKETLSGFANYVGSVAFSNDNERVAVTLPKGNRIAFFQSRTGNLIELKHSTRTFGVSAYNESFMTSSELGVLNSQHDTPKKFHQLAFDNHLSVKRVIIN